MSVPTFKADAAVDDAAAEPYVLEQQIGHLLRKAHQRASAQFLAHMDAIGLTPTQYAALVKIGDVGETSQNHLGRLTAMDPATSQGVIRRLQARGLIELRPDPDDRRRTLLRLSEAGRQLLPRAIARGRVVTRETLAPLAPGEQATLLALLQRLT